MKSYVLTHVAKPNIRYMSDVGPRSEETEHSPENIGYETTQPGNVDVAKFG